MAVPYKLSYLEIETGLSPASTFKHTGDFLANRIIKYLGTSDDILLGDGTTTSLAGKQNTITLTTTGTSGAATLIGATLNIPNYSPDLSGYVTLDTTQTITGAKAFGATITSNRINAIATGDGVAIISAFAFDNSVAGSFRNDTTLAENSPTLFVQQSGDGRIALFQSDTANVIIESDGDIDGVKDLTLTSTIKKSTISTTYTYNLPDANGTIALVGGAGVGTVTSVAALTLGTTGTDLSSTVANSTTTPVITLNVPTASASNRGVVSSTDWTTFNSKQDALNGTGFVKISGTTISYDNSTYLTTIEGIVASGELSGTYASPTLVNSAVTGKVLTGLNITGGTVASTDSILQAFGKVQNQINGLIGGSIFQGTWDASTNNPALASGVGTNGYYYIVSVDGSTNLDGITDWKIGDWAIFAGTTWEKVDNTDAVGSVNGYTGTVSLVTGDVLEGAGTLPSRPSQLYFTDARARAAISLTTTGSSGASTYDNITGVLNVPNYGSALTAYVPYSGATSNVDLGTFNITATSLIKAGGVDTQFLKADGSVDNNNYLTANDLPSTLSLYATNVPADVTDYFKLVTTIDDPDYNTIAVDVPTGEITTTDQLIASLVSPVNLINGNPGVFNVTTTGNITRISGSGEAEFFFRIYKRDSVGVETLVGTSGNTIPVINTGYSEFFATAIWNDGIFDVTDSIVLKYYANRIAGGSNPTYQFQFGGDQPVRTIVPIPTAVIPNIFLEELADVEDGVVSNNDGIFFDSSVSLWKYKSVAEGLGYTPANDESVVHLTGDEIISDFKTFSSTLRISNTTGNGNGLLIESGATDFYSFLRTQDGLTANSVIVLPSSNGTLALTSALTAYVPYTGATGLVNLGAYDLTVNGVSVGRGGGAINTNILVGSQSGLNNTTGSFNSFFGSYAGNRNTTGSNNSFFGSFAGVFNTTGSFNTLIGHYAGAYINSGAINSISTNSVYLGYDTRASVNGNTNEIVIGHSARGGGSNSATLGNSSIATTILHGNTSIGYTTNPSLYKLDVNGTLRVAGAATFSGMTTINGSGENLRLGTNTSDNYITFRNSSNVQIGDIGYDGRDTGGLSIWNASGSLVFGAGGARALTIASTGAATFSSTGTANSIFIGGIAASGGYGLVSLNGTNAEGQYIGIAGGGSSGTDKSLYYNSGNGGSHIFRTGNGSAYSEKMVLTSGGNVLIGTTTDAGYKLYVNGNARVNGSLESRGANAGLFFENRISTNILGFYADNNTNFNVYNEAIGNIATINQTSGAYTALSDVNKKKDFEQSQIGLNAILGLKPTLYRMKTDAENTDKHLGFIAQEVKEFIPQAYTESGEDENKFIGLTEMPIIATLVKAIQELNEKITQLENK